MRQTVRKNEGQGGEDSRLRKQVVEEGYGGENGDAWLWLRPVCMMKQDAVKFGKILPNA